MISGTEDQVRDDARIILNFHNDEFATSGVGQLTTFNQLDNYYWGGFPINLMVGICQMTKAYQQ